MKIYTTAEALFNATARHYLSAPAESVAEVADSLVGLHNTTQYSPYLSARARVSGFDRHEMEALMYDSWQLVRFRAMRLTMFVFTRELLPIAASATRSLGDSLTERWLRDSGHSPAEFNHLASRVADALADGPLTTRALRKQLGVPSSVDMPGVVGRICDLGVLVGGAPPRSWRSSTRQYHRWVDVLPDLDPFGWDEDAAITELVLRYVRSYGPVTIDDISWWTGLTKARSREVLETLGQQAEEVSVDGWPGPLFQAAERDPPPRTASTIRALPLLDPYVQGYRDRGRFLDPSRHDFVYDGGGNAAATLVHDGRIVGIWQPTEDPAAAVRYHFFEPPSHRLRRAAELELAAAGSLYFGQEVDVIDCKTMKPLSAEGGRSAMHPLDSTLHRGIAAAA